MTFEEELAKVRVELQKVEAFDIRKESHPGGWRLWIEDVIAEETILLLLIQERDQGMKTTATLYEEAKKRAIARDTEEFDGIRNGFEDGISAVTHRGGIDRRRWLEVIVSRIKSESNYGFAFVCGMLCKLEAVKGKHYQASWQKHGETNAFANMSRKTDRLEAIMSGQQGGENLSQTLGDAAVYAIKWIVLRNEINPEEFLGLLTEILSLENRGEEKEKSEAKANPVPRVRI